jgi:hypothetical protein
MTIGSRSVANCEAAQICSGGLTFQDVGVVGAAPLPRMGISVRSEGYRIKDTTIAMVSKAIVAINTLWPQRAIDPSILKSPGNIIARHGNSGKVAASLHHYGCDSLQFNLSRL